jgi:hypothetical protein
MRRTLAGAIATELGQLVRLNELDLGENQLTSKYRAAHSIVRAWVGARILGW